jgi:hypothetical protein
MRDFSKWNIDKLWIREIREPRGKLYIQDLIYLPEGKKIASVLKTKAKQRGLGGNMFWR